VPAPSSLPSWVQCQPVLVGCALRFGPEAGDWPGRVLKGREALTPSVASLRWAIPRVPALPPSTAGFSNPIAIAGVSANTRVGDRPQVGPLQKSARLAQQVACYRGTQGLA
jgi:hypothetical protein